MKKEHLRLAGLVLAFLAGLSVLLLALSRAYSPRDNTKKGGMDYNQAHGYMAYEPEELEVFFVGCSNYYNAISPLMLWDQTGITSYDMCTGGQVISEADKHISEILSSHHPKVIVLDAYAVIRENELNDALFTTAALYYPILEHHNNWKRFDLEKILSPTEYTYRNQLKGYRISHGLQPFDPGDYMAEDGEKTPYHLMNRVYLRHIVQLCRSHDCELLLLAMPAPAIWNYSCHQAIGADAKRLGVPFVDLNLMTEELGVDWQKDFGDWGDHMNADGARKMTTYIGTYLNEHYDLTDHRGDDAFAQWEADARDNDE